MLSRIALLIGLALLGCDRDKPKPTLHEDGAPVVARAEEEPKPDVPKWYEGGTLGGADAATWKVATQENKLATCADMLASLWIGKKLKPDFAAKIQSVDDLKGPAGQLVIALDKALSGDAGALNVATSAAMLMAMMGWV